MTLLPITFGNTATTRAPRCALLKFSAALPRRSARLLCVRCQGVSGIRINGASREFCWNRSRDGSKESDANWRKLLILPPFTGWCATRLEVSGGSEHLPYTTSVTASGLILERLLNWCTCTREQRPTHGLLTLAVKPSIRRFCRNR